MTSGSALTAWMASRVPSTLRRARGLTSASAVTKGKARRAVLELIVQGTGEGASARFPDLAHGVLVLQDQGYRHGRDRGRDQQHDRRKVPVREP